MSFVIEETPTALDQLAALWLQATSSRRRAITAATHRLTSALRRPTAPSLGISYPVGQLPTARRLDDPPLAAVFVVMRTVGVVSIIDYLDSASP